MRSEAKPSNLEELFALHKHWKISKAPLCERHFITSSSRISWIAKTALHPVVLPSCSLQVSTVAPARCALTIWWTRLDHLESPWLVRPVKSCWSSANWLPDSPMQCFKLQSTDNCIWGDDRETRARNAVKTAFTNFLLSCLMRSIIIYNYCSNLFYNTACSFGTISYHSLVTFVLAPQSDALSSWLAGW